MQDQSLFKEYKGVFEEAETKEVKEKSTENKSFFVLSDIFGGGDIKKIWIEYIKLRSVGIEPEVLCGMLIAKARDMLFAQKGSALDLGIHPFVYAKAKKDFKNWQVEKLKKAYDALVFAYHDARMSGASLDVELEKIILSI